jgi:hypothetical protein
MIDRAAFAVSRYEFSQRRTAATESVGLWSASVVGRLLRCSPALVRALAHENPREYKQILPD